MDKNLLFLIIGIFLVTLPILIGILKGHVPKGILKSWAVPMAITTFLLAMTVQTIDAYLNPQTKLGISLLFSIAWIAAGAYMGYIQSRSAKEIPEQIKIGVQTIGRMFLGFGMIWALVSVFQYFNPHSK